jgi:hypothetical protein
MACGDDKARFRAVILDPDLTATAPRHVAPSGPRARSETTSHATQPAAQLPSRKALAAAGASLIPALDDPDGGFHEDAVRGVSAGGRRSSRPCSGGARYVTR